MGNPEKKVSALPHHIILQDRKVLEVSGVSDVDSFDDMVVVAYTTMGALTVRGKGLHVKLLNLEEGSLSVEGQIDALSYDDMAKGGFFSRLLR